MEDEMILEINAPRKTRRARDEIAEEVAREYIHKFFVQDKVQDLMKGDQRIIVSFEVINPKKNLMKDFRSLFVRTKIKGWINEYRAKLVSLASTIFEMCVTPDLALLLQVIVMKGAFLATEKCRFAIALVEVKRGNAKLSQDQKKDVEKARTCGIPYYLLRVDDSDFLNGKFKLKLKPLTAPLLLSVPKT
jgi:hypothetical protein